MMLAMLVTYQVMRIGIVDVPGPTPDRVRFTVASRPPATRSLAPPESLRPTSPAWPGTIGRFA